MPGLSESASGGIGHRRGASKQQRSTFGGFGDAFGVEAIAAPDRRSISYDDLLAALHLRVLGDQRPFAAVRERVSGRQTMLKTFPSSFLELLDKVIRLVPELPVLLVVSFRTEFAAPWIGHAGVTLLALSRLDRRQATQLAKQVNTKHRLTPTLLDRLVVQTDGVPLFIEELTAAQPDGATLVVPDTLQASLMARLDRLPAAKRMAQIGAVIGREFSHALLATVVRLPEAQLSQGLDELVASGLAFRRGDPPDAIDSFKHALVQEAAYDSLLRTRRADMHVRIVNALEVDASFASIGPDVLGFHCTQAGLIAKAANYYRIAGQRTATGLAVPENKAQLERALHLAARLPVGRDCDRLEAELLLALAGVLTWTQGIGSAEALACCRAVGRIDPTPLRSVRTEGPNGAYRSREAANLVIWGMSA